MDDRDRLMLHEEVLLLALRDEKGTIAPGTMYQYALGGAILAELLLRERIVVQQTGKKKLARVVNPTPLGAAVIDECLQMIGASRKEQSLDHWVAKFVNLKGLKHRVAERLVDRGILRQEEGKVLLVFSRRIYPESDSRPEREIVERLDRAIFTDVQDVDARTAVLLSLANATGLLKVVLDRKRLKGRKARIEQVVNGEATGKAAKAAIEAMQAAVMVAVILPSIIASTTATH